jgi:hypothetical protein
LRAKMEKGAGFGPRAASFELRAFTTLDYRISD